MGIGDWGLGIGPNPQSPIPNPQSPIPISSYIDDAAVQNKPLLTSHDLSFTSKSGKTYMIQVEATNSVGTTLSSLVQFVLADVPVMPVPIVARGTQTSYNIIQAIYLATSSNGGSDILESEIQMDDGINGAFSSLKTSQQTSILIDSNIIKGRTYRFKYRVRNINGWSEYSEISYIDAADKPATPKQIQYVSATTTKMKIKINFSEDNGGSNLTGCELYIDKGNDFTSKFTKIIDSLYNGKSTLYEFENTKDSLKDPGALYRVKSLCINKYGMSNFSDELKIGLGPWGLGIGDWGLGIGPNPQSPIPNPQSPFNYYYIILYLLIYTINLKNKYISLIHLYSFIIYSPIICLNIKILSYITFYKL